MFVFQCFFAKKLTRISLEIVLVSGPLGNTNLPITQHCTENFQKSKHHMIDIMTLFDVPKGHIDEFINKI